MAKARVAILISGRGSNMAALIYAAKREDCPFEIVLVSSDNPDAPGLDLAEAEGVDVKRLPPYSAKDKSQFYAALDLCIQNAAVDYIALAGFMRIVPPEFVGKWQGRMLNIHPSLLPKYKGLDTHERALAAQDSETGCSVHEVTAALDDGQVLGQISIAIQPGDSAETLAARVLIAEHQLYARVLADFVTRETRPEALLDRVRALALALPQSEEKKSHGSQGFFVTGGKFFAYFSHQHHGDGVTALLVKASGLEEQAMLIEQDPDLYYRPQYFGPSGWIGIRLDQGAVDWPHIEDWLRKSWALSAPAKLRRAHDLAAEF